MTITQVAEKTMLTERKKRVVTKLPGPKAQALLARDAQMLPSSYARDYPFVMDYGRGAEVWDVCATAAARSFRRTSPVDDHGKTARSAALSQSFQGRGRQR